MFFLKKIQKKSQKIELFVLRFYICAMIDYRFVPSPCFVLEETRLRHNLEILDYVQKKSGAKIICALKGFSMWSTFPIVAEYLPGATASS